MSTNNYPNKDQAVELINEMTLPVLGGGGGFAPIGTINFFDASAAPEGWLTCDGTVYNISDYPELATFYASVHGASNFYGGNGTTTFAVPDLRGEFLRGSGTNSHTNQGSGANVGVHQDGTLDNYVFGGDGYLITSNDGLHISNTDHSTKANTDVYIQGTSRSSTFDQTMSYTSRPTNTSFLICVKATVAGDPNAHVYSTEEQVVGTWIDGSDIYERVYNNLNINLIADTWTTMVDISNVGIDQVISVNGGGDSSNGKKTYQLNSKINGNNLQCFCAGIGTPKVEYIIVRYTKTQSGGA